MNQPQQTIRLPDVVKFIMPAQHAVVILDALGNHGPVKVVQPVIQNFEQQLLAQQVRLPAEQAATSGEAGQVQESAVDAGAEAAPTPDLVDELFP